MADIHFRLFFFGGLAIPGRRVAAAPQRSALGYYVIAPSGREDQLGIAERVGGRAVAYGSAAARSPSTSQTSREKNELRSLVVERQRSEWIGPFLGLGRLAS